MDLAPSMIPAAARCRGCGYALRGLTHLRCPECGRPFDPADGRTMRLPFRRRRTRRLIHVAGDVGLAVVALTAVGRWTGGDEMLAVGWLAWVLLATLLIGQRVAGVLDWVTGPLSPPASAVARASRRLAAVCLLAAVAGNVSWGACPHSRWLVVGPVGVCHSPHGMCDNAGSPAGYLMPLMDGWYLIGCDQFGHV